MNEHDSEKIAGIFNNDGMTKSDDIDNADVLFVNTCTIRENADDKLYGTLGHLKKWKSLAPNRRLLVGGCAAQKDKELVRERAPWVDVVIGTHNTTEVINLLNQAEDWGPITEIIEETVLEKQLSYMDAVLYVCEMNSIDLEDVKKFISPIIKGKIEAEAMSLNFLPKQNTLF